MADVSKSEILKKYPIGIGLDTFRETCPALGARGSPDAMEHLNTEGELPKIATGSLSNVPSAQEPRS